MKLLKGHEGKKIKFMVNGFEVDAILSIQYEHEQDKPDFDYGSKEENDKEMKRFKSGELLNLYIQVSIFGEELEGMDSLGQCFIRAKYFESDILETIKEYQMIENAKTELIQKILDSAVKLQKFIPNGKEPIL
jgi:hypothetical protein